MRKMNEMATSITTLGDEELTAVSGARFLLPVCWPPFHKHGYKSVTQSNTIGDVSLDASGNSGTVSVTISQSNSAS